ncbi:MAG: PAS domain S-box protein, partial [Janthinobacterium lividum]
MQNAHQLQQAAAAQAEHLGNELIQKLRVYQFGLRGTSGVVFAAGEEGINREIFRRFSSGRDLETQFPGAKGFGFARRVPRNEVDRFLDRAQVNVDPAFNIRQAAPHSGDRYIIEYVEPLESNRSAIGFDIASEPRRRDAAILAMRTGQATLTAPIALVKDIEQGDRNTVQSFLLLWPLYRSGSIPKTLAEREAGILGWSFVPLEMRTVFSGIKFEKDQYHLALADVTRNGSKVPFYETSAKDPGKKVAFAQTVKRDVFGRCWEYSFSFYPAFVKTLNQPSPQLILLCGLFFSALLYLLASMVDKSQHRKKQLVVQQARLATIVQNSSDAIISEDMAGNIVSWNGAAEQLFGYTMREALGKPLVGLLIPKSEQQHYLDRFKRIVNNDVVLPTDSRWVNKNQELIDVTTTASAIREADGRISGVAKVIHDIRGRKAAETRLQEFNAELETQVQQRTAELEKARRTLQSILDAIPSMIGYWDTNLINHVANPAYLDWHGVDPAALYGTHLRDLIGPVAFEKSLPYINGALAGHLKTFERTIPRPDGNGIRHALAQLVPDIVNGEVQGFLAVFHDVSDLVVSRLNLAEAVRQNEVLLRTINEQMLYSVTDPNGLILEVNDNFCRASGYRHDELTGQDHRLVNSGFHPAEFWQDMWRTIKSGHAWHGEVCNRGRDGMLRWFDTVIAPYVGAKGEIERYVALRSDVTSRKAIEAKSNEVTSLLGNVLRSASEIAIIATDVDGLITIFNSGAQRMLGYTEAEMVRNSCPGSFHLDEEIRARGLELSRQLGQPIEGLQVLVTIPKQQVMEVREWTYQHKDGHHLEVSLTVTAMRDDGGAVSGYLFLAEDIGQRKEAEHQVLRAKQAAEDASAAKGQFLANMSHEIRTPMNAVLGMLQLLQKTALAPRQRDFVDKAFSAGRSLLGLLNDILDFSKIEAGKLDLDLHPFDLEDLMQELSIVLFGNQGEKKVDVLFDIDPLLSQKLIGDKLRLLQILINLAGNALKFTERGHVIVSIEMVARTAREVCVAFAVQDTGIGMTEEQSERIFSGFSQAEASISRRFGGTGLGLAICTRLVALMKGKVAVQSAPGKGSRFSFQIVLQLDDSAAALALPLPQLAAPPRVLLVDDDELTLKLLAKTGRSLGWQLDTASSGRQAIERVHDALAAGRAYQVVVMDWRMPGMDGLQAAKSIQREIDGAGRPAIIMVTAYGREEVVEAQMGQEVPFVDFLIKPVTPRQISTAVHEALHGSRQAAYPGSDRQDAKRLRGMQLLVVEDNAINRQVAAELLGGEGAQVHLAEGGLLGVEMVVSGRQQFDVVIMDVQMPDIDGLEATRRIRRDARFASLPIMAMTANVSTADRQACLDAGMTDHIGKPFVLDHVVERLL